MNTFELLTQVVPHLMVAVAGYIHWCNRPWVRDASRKVVTDPRLGQLVAPKHFNSPTKSCFEYGCTDDCPVARNR